MAGLSQKGSALLLDTLTGVSAYGLPTVYAALFTSAPSASAAGTEITTGQYSGYARQALTGSSWSGANSSGASTYNALIDFGQAATSSGTNLVGIGFFDASSGGNYLFWEPLTSTAISAGSHITFQSGQFILTIPPLAAGNGYATTYAQKFVDHITGKTAFGSPPSLFLALCSAASTASAIGTEVVYTGYSSAGRPQATTGNCNAATIATPSVVTLIAAVLFGADTGGTQTAATNFAVCDSATVGAGNLIASATVSGGTVAAGSTPDFPAGSTILSLQ